jgi:transcription antitermination factor NusG
MSIRFNQSVSKYYWRAFYTHARAEKKCEYRLEEKNIEVFLPVQTEIRQWKDRKKKVEVPLFRNYIFARVDERRRIDVLQTQGIVRCISFGGVLAEVKQEEIDQIKLLQTCPERLEKVDVLPSQLVGSNVKIDRGPLRGLKGEIIDIRGDTRLIVRITSLNMAMKVEVPYGITTKSA